MTSPPEPAMQDWAHAMSDTSHDHEIVSIYGMSEEQIDTLMTEARLDVVDGRPGHSAQ